LGNRPGAAKGENLIDHLRRERQERKNLSVGVVTDEKIGPLRVPNWFKQKV